MYYCCMCCLVSSCHFIPCHVISCHLMCCLVLSCLVLCCLVLCCLVLCCVVLSPPTEAHVSEASGGSEQSLRRPSAEARSV
jgi:hypothetical protein